MPFPRIALLSPPVGGGNLGDEGILAAAIQGIRHHRPDAEVYVISPNPEDTRRRHGIEAYPMSWTRPRIAPPAGTAMGGAPRDPGRGERAKAVLKRVPVLYPLLKGVRTALAVLLAIAREVRFLAAARRRLRGTDMLLMTGSGALCDHFSGPLGFPYPIFKWSLLARLSRIPTAFPSVGAGPLRSRLSRYFVRASLARASYRSAREVTSRRVLDDLGLPGETPVFPDLAFGLGDPPPAPRPGGGPPVVGINPFPHFDPRFWPESNPARYERYLTCMASFTERLLGTGHRVLLFPTQAPADVRVIEDLKRLLSRRSAADARESLLEPQVRDVPELIAALALTDLVVASRFHGILFSFFCGRPVVAITNHHKMKDLMQSMGQAAYSLDVESLTLASLVDRFTALEADRQAVGCEISRRVAEFRAALDRQYAALLGEHAQR